MDCKLCSYRVGWARGLGGGGLGPVVYFGGGVGGASRVGGALRAYKQGKG